MLSIYGFLLSRFLLDLDETHAITTCEQLLSEGSIFEIESLAVNDKKVIDDRGHQMNQYPLFRIQKGCANIESVQTSNLRNKVNKKRQSQCEKLSSIDGMQIK